MATPEVTRDALYQAAVGPRGASYYVPKFLKFQRDHSRLCWNLAAFLLSSRILVEEEEVEREDLPMDLRVDMGTVTIRFMGGSPLLAGVRMARVLASSGYHYQFVFARNAAQGDRPTLSQTLPEALEWVWKGYQPR